MHALPKKDVCLLKSLTFNYVGRNMISLDREKRAGSRSLALIGWSDINCKKKAVLEQINSGEITLRKGQRTEKNLNPPRHKSVWWQTWRYHDGLSLLILPLDEDGPLQTLSVFLWLFSALNTISVFGEMRSGVISSSQISPQALF